MLDKLSILDIMTQKEKHMTTDTYIVMSGYKILGYIEAYSNYHAITQAKKLYDGQNLIVERISKNIKV
jgi:hypothetical protein